MKKQEKSSSYLQDVFRRFKAHKLAMVGLCVIILEVLLVFLLPMIFDLDPYSSDINAFGAVPSAEHILGTDDIGRDIFARLIYGGQVSLFVGLVSTLISVAIGVPLGVIAGYYGGIFETIVMRSADVFMSFPSIILILVLVSVVGPSIFTVTLVIGIMGWTQFARLIYGNVLSVREKDYVESARAIGEKNLRIITKYILPNTFAPVLIALTFSTANAIIMESDKAMITFLLYRSAHTPAKGEIKKVGKKPHIIDMVSIIPDFVSNVMYHVIAY